MCTSCTRDTDGIVAKLLRCGIASEALRRNMPLRYKQCVAPWVATMLRHQRLAIEVLVVFRDAT